MTLEFVGKVFKAEKKEYEGKQYFKNVLREIDTGRFVSLNTEEALEVDEWYNVKTKKY